MLAITGSVKYDVTKTMHRGHLLIIRISTQSLNFDVNVPTVDVLVNTAPIPEKLFPIVEEYRLFVSKVDG